MQLKKPKQVESSQCVLSVRLEKMLYEQFVEECRRVGITTSEGIRQLLRNYLNSELGACD